ncbi:AAA family ATPase [Hoeflea sp. YIM 152468]|uniref:AAA family ATPase n=1 Tax=Hoeflea sp. YIM 152468 TaxID=3031759 RepID=UPI0023DAB859|nr:AAA family ATPase [Hoeflea sp. YIM 152468]MDF1608328.1 AAA family ATPase [Hoeflea sp. YIM 152468]
MRRFVITGASGSGKSTLVDALAASGYATVAEVGRQIVAEQMASHGTALPWRDKAAFMDLLFVRSIARFDQTGEAADEIVFFDRSFIEAIAYGTVIGRAPAPAMLQAAALRRFETPAFVCPPWRAIFANDRERRHDFEFACKEYEANVAAYVAAGYDLIEVPPAPVSDRVSFIRHRLDDLSGC